MTKWQKFRSWFWGEETIFDAAFLVATHLGENYVYKDEKIVISRTRINKPIDLITISVRNETVYDGGYFVRLDVKRYRKGAWREYLMLELLPKARVVFKNALKQHKLAKKSAFSRIDDSEIFSDLYK